MDEIDQAQANDELFRQSALSAHFAVRRLNGGPDAIDPPLSRPCCDCGEEIESARLKALPCAVRCVDCQGKKERRERLHG